MNHIKFVLLFCFFGLSANAQLPKSEQKALEDLYRFTNGNAWQHTWNHSNNNQESFFGVTIVNDHVVKLELSHNKLEGELPSSLNDLTYLEHLDLSDNVLSGELPKLNGLVRLKVLIVNDNELSGVIPESLKELQNLERLKIAENYFSNPEDFEQLETEIFNRYLTSNSE